MSKDFFSLDVGAAQQSFSLTQVEEIPVDGEAITAFVGPAPRGPADRAVTIASPEQFEKLFGAPEYYCRMGFAIRQFFANGGRRAVVVRVTASTDYNRIVLRAGEGRLVLTARNPGPLEFLRASVDYDAIPADESARFNIVVQRLRSAESVWIDEQECFRSVSVDPTSRDYLGKVLAQSDLVRIVGAPPAARPDLTIKHGSIRESGYVSALAGDLGSPPPSDYDLIGSGAAGTGLTALESVRDIAHLCLISGAADAAVGPVAMLAAERFCRRHQALLLVDPPARWTSVAAVIADQRRSDFASANSVTWFPCATLRTSAGNQVTASATGAVAAALVEADRTRCIDRLHSDALVMPRGNLRAAATCSAPDQQRLARAGINHLSQRSALHLQLRGNVTQSRHANPLAGCNELSTRADMLFIARRIRLGTRWVAFHESSPRVWRELREQIAAFFQDLHARGRLAGQGGEDSWTVCCDRETNRGHEHATGGVVFTVGFALRKPGELFRLRFEQNQLGCQVAELGWQCVPDMRVSQYR